MGSISNAIKYTDNGEVVLTTSLENNKLIIVCSDTGQGIAEEAQASLFDPYVRLNEKKNSYIQGTGLGLSIVKKIVENLNGTIELSSKLKEGSTFTVTIPVELSDVGPAGNKEEADVFSYNIEEDDFDFSKIRVLCVDDSKINATVMKSLLKKIGMKADVAFSAMEGLEKLETDKYDLIFMDHMMPKMSGIEAFEAIRSGNSINAKTPVVMLTGNADISYADYYKQIGVEGYLVKPVMMEGIKQMTLSLLR